MIASKFAPHPNPLPARGERGQRCLTVAIERDGIPSRVRGEGQGEGPRNVRILRSVPQ